MIDITKDQIDALDDSSFLEMIDQGTLTIRDGLQQQIDALHIEARYWCDKFWAMNQVMRDDDPGWLGTRVIPAGASFSIVWYKNTYPKNKNGQSKQPFSKHLFKPKGAFKYDMVKFGFANKWEKDMVKIIEPNYARIRLELDNIKQLKKSVTAFSADRKRKMLVAMNKHSY